MAATDGLAVVTLGVDDADGRARAVDRSRTGTRTKRTGASSCATASCSAFATGMLLVATAALLPYSGNNAWISMVLVTASHRRRGLATRLVDACLETARKNGLTSWLDATPDGRHGLRAARLHADAAIAAVEAGEADPGRNATIFIREHRCASRARSARDRARSHRPAVRPSRGAPARASSAANGAIALVRDGRTARHIGPLFADNAAAGADPGRGHRTLRERTVADRCRRPAGRVPGRTDRLGLDHRAAVPAHAVRPRHHHG